MAIKNIEEIKKNLQEYLTSEHQDRANILIDNFIGINREIDILIIKHENTPLEVIECIAEKNKEHYVPNADNFVEKIAKERLNEIYDIQEKMSKKAKSKDKNERVEAAINIYTPIEILEELSNDKENEVRAELCLNPSTPIEILKKLSNGDSYVVKEYIALNINTPIDILIKLAEKDFTELIASCLARNPNTPEYIKKKIEENEENSMMDCQTTLRKYDSFDR